MVSWGHQVLNLCFAQDFMVTPEEPFPHTHSVKFKK